MRDLLWPIVVLFLLAIVLRSELFFYLLYVVVGLHAAARLWVGQGARGLRATRVMPETAFPGEPVPVTIELENQSLLPLPWLSAHETLPPALHTPPMVRAVVSLGPHQRQTLSYTLVGRRRGFYHVGPLDLRTGDVLGLGDRTLAGLPWHDLTVFPEVRPLPELGLPASLPFGTLPARQRLFNDPARPAGVRPYQPADGVRRIDWKATARVGEPQVRRYQPAIALETLLALAFSRAEYGGMFAIDTMERALTATASIAAQLAGQRQSFALCTTGVDAASGAPSDGVGAGRGRSHLIHLLGVLGRLEPAATGDLAALLTRSAGGLGWGSTVVVVTGQHSAELLPELLALRRRGLNVALVLAEPTTVDLELPARHGIAAYELQREGVVVER